MGTLLCVDEARGNLTFNLVPDAGTPQQVINGFTAAANLWSARIGNDVTINVQIGLADLGPSVLGATSVQFFETPYSQFLSALSAVRSSPDDFSSFNSLQPGASYQRLINHTSNNPNGANSSTSYTDTMDRVGLTTANAKALGLVAPSADLDATIRFSSSFNFTYDHNAPIPRTMLDFVGIAAHEIGHALGYVSGVDDIDYSGGAYPGDAFSSNALDLFRYSNLSLSAGTGYSDYTADTRGKFFSVDGGLTSLALFSNGYNYGDARQASHWKDNLGIGIMDPTAMPGERLDIAAMDLRAFDVIGYTIVPEPAAASLAAASLACLLLRRRLPRP